MEYTLDIDDNYTVKITKTFHDRGMSSATIGINAEITHKKVKLSRPIVRSRSVKECSILDQLFRRTWEDKVRNVEKELIKEIKQFVKGIPELVG